MRVLFPGAAMFEAARTTGAAMTDALPDLALTHAVIDAPLLLRKTLVGTLTLIYTSLV